jgi:alpha-tubulin suppressor-like RCC1 family protein
MIELTPRWRTIVGPLLLVALGACERRVVLGSDDPPDATVVGEDVVVFEEPLVHPPDRPDAPRDITADALGVDATDASDASVDVAPDLPRPTRSGPSTSLALGDRHGCALDRDGTVWCWGANDHGQVGDGTTTDRDRPEPVLGLRGVTSLTAGAEHTCALVGTRVWCWGRGGDGRLMRAGDADATRPIDTGVDALSVAAGSAHTCVRRATGVACWGANDVGQLGADSAGTLVALPRPATGVYSGGAFACAVLDDGAAWCWGSNEVGQLGRGTRSAREAPGPVTGVSEVRRINAGARHACATTASAVWCWGDRGVGQLGDGVGAPAPTPTRSAVWLPGENLACGDAFTCAQSAVEVRCAGLNDRGQLGDGTTTSQPTPVTALGFPRTVVLLVALGARHTCAETSDLVTWCWGDGTAGQLGNGSRGVVTTRQPVRW